MVKLLSQYKRIVVKLGSSLLVDPVDGLKQQWLQSLLEDIRVLKQSGCEVLLVSSGAIALGRKILALPPGNLKLEESQAAAAAGQISLASTFSSKLDSLGMRTGQILLTYGDTEERRRYLNARATIETLLKLSAIPIINENDTVATSEIRYGDNDRLAARVATMMSADLLILLSDIDGLYTSPPGTSTNSRLVTDVPEITPQIEAMAGDAGTQLSSGGMKTKISAARIATQSGTAMIISSGKDLHPLKALDNNVSHTFFHPLENPQRARKKWIAGQLQTNGKIIIDKGAQSALAGGKSLLPAGVRSISGTFSRGDMVTIANTEKDILGQGIIAYDADITARIIGKRSADIEKILGYAGRTELIHRDDMNLIQPTDTDNLDA